MNIQKIEHSLDTLDMSNADLRNHDWPTSWAKPERDLSTPRGRLLAVRDVAVGVPNEKFHMLEYFPSFPEETCGCAMFHAVRAGIPVKDVPWDDYFNLTLTQVNHLFAYYGNPNTYREPNGAPAKAEFLRRIDEVLATSQP